LFYKGTALRVLRFVLSALSAAFLAACVASAQAPDSAARPAQLIVKFRAPVEPEHPAFIDDLSRDAGAPLQYVRPMSGGAHVFTLKEPVRPEALAEILERLAGRQDVEYAVENRMMRHQ